MTATATEPITTANRLLAVLDDPAGAAVVARALADAGIGPDRVVVLAGSDGLARLEARSAAGPLQRAMRFLSFIAVDQAVDVAWYEAALADGRAVLVLRVPERDLRLAAVDVLRRAGAHFVNHYGRMATEDIVPWRGMRPELHWIHHR